MRIFIIRYFLLFIFVLSGCEVSKPRADGADNELILVSSFEDRDDIKSILSIIFNDTLYSPQPEPYYKIKWVEPKNFDDIKSHVNVIIAAIGQDVNNMGARLVKNILSKYITKYLGSYQVVLYLCVLYSICYFASKHE